MLERYSRQTVFPGIGDEGQQKLLSSRVAVLGMGALGTVIANNLARAGVGFIRLIDRDFVELSNLQRQTLYNENDVRENLPKATAAYEHLKLVNSEITLEPKVTDISAKTILPLIEDMDLILDGTDNLETRFIINEACCKLNKPWIYGAAVASYGASMNIIPGVTPCLHCLYPFTASPGSIETCTTAGVLNMITGMIGSIESAEAVKLLTGSPALRKGLLQIGVWKNYYDNVEIIKNPDCPVCGKRDFAWLNSFSGSYTTSLCGRDSIQVVPASTAAIDFERLAAKLEKAGSVQYNAYLLRFNKDDLEITLFKDGRAIIKNAKSENAAKSIYAEYIGL